MLKSFSFSQFGCFRVIEPLLETRFFNEIQSLIDDKKNYKINFVVAYGKLNFGPVELIRYGKNKVFH